ncbi:alpha/beta hydrolase [Amycolatopsis sp. CA-230715]|uniref:alpha/beta hydrolase n=1 Tax=Amycolatopsis sp. CA-230715 TaxID=2745196 RepID=UPI001C01447C|nr:alpha/beta hydrolase [Amycolatopsis sp. CA-230715]QWF82450.1 Tripeptidyl aminopeptidase [Amycolatopsis sp. CA-230715]
MKKLRAAVAAAVLVTGLVPAMPAAAQPGLPWAPCAEADLAKLGLDCATLAVPLDHARPHGPTVTLALSRKKAAAPKGVLVVNPGGPGITGRAVAGTVAGAMPPDLVASYDIIGIDPRGVGASTPSMSCDKDYFAPPWPDPVPSNAGEELRLLSRPLAYTMKCAAKYGSLLPHMSTEDSARDLDDVRRALGQPTIDYLGYGYGTYVGSVYGTLFPGKLRRAVLDSVARQDADWYRHYIEQEDPGFDARSKDFFAWVAGKDDVYHLGTAPETVAAAYYGARGAVKAKPAGGVVGPFEFEATFHNVAWESGLWPFLANTLAAFHHGDEKAVVTAYQAIAAHHGDNDYAVFTAVQCADTAWPRDWRQWHDDATKLHATAPFATWNNTWYLSPCAFWPRAPRTPVPITGAGLPPALIVHATDDIALAYRDAQRLHATLPGSRLVTEQGGLNPAVTFLRGNPCVDAPAAAYLATGKLPAADLSCPAPIG